MKYALGLFLCSLLIIQCDSSKNELAVNIVQTSAAGDKLSVMSPLKNSETSTIISIDKSQHFQTITGFGGAFTESSAFLLNQLSKEKRSEILEAYFSEEGAQYSLTRTHMNSCDFSLEHYSFASIKDDTSLVHFSIKEDKDDIIPMILEAQKISKNGFKIIASPWTAPPWMKDNNDWYGGKLRKEFYPSWASFFTKYYKAFEAEGIDIWAFTVENEPLGNDSHWESMHYTPVEMVDFVKNHLAPTLSQDSIDAHILVYDQNRGEELEEWVEVMLTDKALTPLIYGTAVHWYSGTVNWFPESLNYTHDLAPDKHIIHTEACVDSEIPHWNDDAWYWSKEATDWGWDWATEENKPNHPKYVPVYRYARDIIGCLNNWVEGWIDWNMVLDEKGGPNLANNWCVAPIIVDIEKDEVYYTPLYYTISHFSKFIKPEATRIGVECSDKDLMTTAIQNEDGSVVLIVLNMTEKEKRFEIQMEDQKISVSIAEKALQTISINK